MNYSVYTYMSKACRLAWGIAFATALHYSAGAFAQDAFELEMLEQEGHPPAPHAQQLSEEEILAMEASEEAGRAPKPLTQPLSEKELRALEASEDQGRVPKPLTQPLSEKGPRAQEASVQATRRRVANGKIRGLVAAARGQSGKAPRLGKTRDGYLRFFGAPETGRAMVAENLLQRSPEEQARGFVLDHAEAFGVTSPDMDFKIHKVRSKGERNYVRMRQTYAGLPVFCAETIVQLDNAGGVHAVFSDIMRDARRFEEDGVSLVPTISAVQIGAYALAGRKEALDEIVAESLRQLDETEPSEKFTEARIKERRRDLLATALETRTEPELLIYDPEVLGNRGEPCLAWRVEVASTLHDFLKEEVVVDAHSGGVLVAISQIHAATSRNIYDCAYSESTAGADKIWDETGPLEWILYPNYLFFGRNFEGFGQARDYYLSEHGWDFYDHYYDEGYHDGAIHSYMYFALVHEGGAAWTGNHFTFGIAGVDESDDIIGHEYTHAVTQKLSNLVYHNESGAINESMSDIFGEFIDIRTGGWAVDWAFDTWLIGENVWGGAIRNMADPPNPVNPFYGRVSPSFYKSSLWYEYPDPDNVSGDDVMDYVHINSGVGNKLCYLITAGDTHRGYTVAPLMTDLNDSIDLASDLYWECQNLLGRAADYTTLYHALTQAAKDPDLALTASQIANIELACQAVNIAPDGPAFTIRNQDGNDGLQIQSDGDLVLTGGGVVRDNQTDDLEPYSERPEFIIRKWPNTSEDVVVRYDASSGKVNSGDLYLKGTLHENVDVLTQDPDNPEFLIRNPSGEIVAKIDMSGSLWLKGHLEDRWGPLR